MPFCARKETKPKLSLTLLGMKLQADAATLFWQCEQLSALSAVCRGSEASDVEGGAVKDFLQRTAAWAWFSTELSRCFAPVSVLASFRQLSHRTFTPWICRTRTARSTAQEASGAAVFLSQMRWYPIPGHLARLALAMRRGAKDRFCPATQEKCPQPGCSSSKVSESFRVQTISVNELLNVARWRRSNLGRT